MAIQEHPNSQSCNQKQGFYSVAKWQNGNADENEQHGPQPPSHTPIEFYDIKRSQKGHHPDEEEDDAQKQVPAFHSFLLLKGMMSSRPSTMSSIGQAVCQLISGMY